MRVLVVATVFCFLAAVCAAARPLATLDANADEDVESVSFLVVIFSLSLGARAASSRSWVWQIMKSMNRMLLTNTLELMKITFIMVYAWPILKFGYRWSKWHSFSSFIFFCLFCRCKCRCVATYEITKANKNQIFNWLEAWCKHHPALSKTFPL